MLRVHLQKRSDGMEQVSRSARGRAWLGNAGALAKDTRKYVCLSGTFKLWALLMPWDIGAGSKNYLGNHSVRWLHLAYDKSLRKTLPGSSPGDSNRGKNKILVL